MAMADSRRQRIITLCALYAAQGVPWGFMATAVVSYLTERGINDEQAGDLSAIILLPWTFKLIWAPLIDSATIRSMGRRRPWIIGAELMMAVTLLGLLMMGDLTQDLRMLGFMFFLHNCFASLQDVCTDALAIDVLPHAEQGSANGLMWGSKLAGKGFGAFVMAWVMSQSDVWGLQAAVMLQFVFLMLVMLFPLLILERQGEKRFPWSKGAAVETGPVSSTRNPLQVVKELLRGFSLPATLSFALFGVTKLIGSGVNEVVTKTLYTQPLEWSAVDFSKVDGLYGIVPGVFGAVAGGYLANRFGRRKIIIFGFGGYSLVALVFAACPHLWNERWFTAGFLLVTQGFVAVGSVGFLSMAMRITWTKSAATMFTVYMTLSNIGHVVGNKFAGTVRELYKEPVFNLAFFQNQAEWITAYQQTFAFVAIASLLPLLFLPLVDPMGVDVFKYPRVEETDVSELAEGAT